MRFILFVAAFVAYAVFSLADAAPLTNVSGECTFYPNINITAPDMLPAKFLISSADCCNLCANTKGCVASVYNNYFCHLKDAQSPQVGAQGPTAILQMNVPPAPTTAAPSAGNVVIIREVSCQQSGQCDVTSDYTCVTSVYYNNTCLGNQLRVCNTDQTSIAAVTFSGARCSGPSATTQEATGTCEFVPTNQSYDAHYCDVLPAPVKYATVTRTSCDGSCNSGACVTPAVFSTGVCTATSQLSGEFTIAWAFPTYVVYISYLDVSCQGTVQSSIAEPLGVCFTSGSSNTYVENTFASA